MAISHGLAGMGGAAAGAAAVGGYVYLKGIAESYGDEKSQKRCDSLEQALRRSLGRRQLPLPSVSSGCVATQTPLDCPAPVLQLKVAYDAILEYQKKSRKGSSNPKTLVCELLKTWLREHAMDRDLPAKEVQAYRDFCRCLVFDKGPWGGWLWQCGFTHAIAHVEGQLDKLLAVRLRDAGDVRRLLDSLKVEAYYYLLRSLQVLLLSATSFAVPDAMYSMSLGVLKRSSMTPLLLKEASEQDLAKEVQRAWQNDACRLLRALLEQPHVTELIREQEGPKELAEPGTVRVVEVLRGGGLPDRPAGMDTVDPFVKLKLKKGGETCWEAKTRTKYNCRAPEWNEVFFVDVPAEGSSLSLHIVDDNGGKLLDTVFAKAQPIRAEEVLQDQEMKVSLQPNGTLCRDVSNAFLEVRFRALDFSKELKRLELEASGLRLPHLGPVFQEAVVALDDVAYFLELCRETAQLAKLMGDMGAVLLEPQLQQLLGSLEEKAQSFQMKATQLEDLVADHAMGEERRRSSCNVAEAARRLFGSTSASDRSAQQSSDQLQTMQAKILETVAALRQELQAFKGVKDTWGKAQEEAERLLQRLNAAETRERSGKAPAAVPLAPLAPSRSVEVYAVGDKVQVYSASLKVWYPDGVVEEILKEDSSEGPKGSVRVRYASQERSKLVLPDELASSVQRL